MNWENCEGHLKLWLIFASGAKTLSMLHWGWIFGDPTYWLLNTKKKCLSMSYWYLACLTMSGLTVCKFMFNIAASCRIREARGFSQPASSQLCLISVHARNIEQSNHLCRRHERIFMLRQMSSGLWTKQASKFNIETWLPPPSTSLVCWRLSEHRDLTFGIRCRELHG